MAKLKENEEAVEVRSGMLEQLRAARRAGVPLVAIVSFDPAATIGVINKFFSGDREVPIAQWDYSRGLQGVNTKGQQGLREIMTKKDEEGNLVVVDASAFINPSEMLLPLPSKLPADTMLCMLNAQRFITPENMGVVQGVWNCRDPFKSNKRMLLMIGPYMDLPVELAQDVVVIDEALPTSEELGAIVKKLVDTAVKGGMPEPESTVLDKAVDALRGLPAFPAEQVTAMSLTPKYLDVDRLWERKRQMIEATPGLSVWRGKEKFEDIGGLHNIKGFMGKILRGHRQPKVIAFIDEIEKEMAGAIGIGDSSGVSQAMLGILLRYMEDSSAAGMIFVGAPGAGKSMLSKAAGAEIQIPTISFNLSNMKGSYVGDSERNLTRALKVVTAVGGDSVLFIATCNSIAILPPELRRRFNLGIFFFDLPEDEERKVIWAIYQKRYGLDARMKRPTDKDWTPAEIRQCCDVAWRLDCSLEDAAKFVVPVAVSARESVERLRKIANERFISASEPGFYRYKGPGNVDELPIEPSRALGGDVAVN